MENKTILWILAVLVIVQLGITIWAVTSTIEETECPACPDCVCEPTVIKEVEYRDCHDNLDEVEEDMELYEEETGRKVYSLITSKDCDDFLENSYLRPDKEVIGYANTEDGCKIFYVLK